MMDRIRKSLLEINKMRPIFLRLFLLIIILPFSSKYSFSINPTTKTPTKIALLVGVSEYTKNYKNYMRWSATSAHNDIKYLKSILSRNGYTKFIILENEKATRDNILSALKDTLLSSVSSGDIIHFHFSGHGQRIYDNNSDETDGLDETIVPYNAAKLYSEKYYIGENHIRDDELRIHIDEIRKKLGPSGNMTVTIDACYSGSGLRSETLSKSRGSELIMESNEHRLSRTEEIKLEKGFEGFSNSSKIAPMVAFFGSAMDELNYECRSDNQEEIGSLTYAFCKSLSLIKPHQTFHDLFEEIKHIMAYKAPHQNPQAEGSLNKLIYQNTDPSSKIHSDIISTFATDSTLRIKMKKGQFDGYHAGAKIKLNVRSNVHQKFQGYIQDANLVTCTVIIENWELNNSILKEDLIIDLVEIKIVPNQKIYRTPRAYAHINNDSLVSQKFSQFHFVENKKESDLVLDHHPETNKIVLYNAAGTFNESTSLDESFTKINSYFKSELLRNISDKNDNIKAEVSLCLESKKWKSKKKRKHNIQIGDRYKINIKNTGNTTFYYTLIYIDNANSYYIDIPQCDKYNNCSHTAQEMKLEPNESQTFFQIYTVDYPEGIDVMKLITSFEPIDLNFLIKERSNLELKNNSIESFFNTVNNNQKLDKNSYFSITNNIYTIETIILEISE